jgi:uncharacterized phage infection (PIP) family protein YhgE
VAAVDPKTRSGAGRARPVIYVEPHPEGWARRKEGASRVTSVHRTKTEARTAAAQQAKREGTTVVVMDTASDVPPRQGANPEASATERARETADAATQAASEVAGQVQEQAAAVAQTVSTEARAVAQRAQSQARELVTTGRQELRDQAHTQTRRVASTLADVGRQLATMADAAEDPDADVARLARRAAERAEQAAARLEDAGLDGLIDDAKRFARNRPGAFLLASVGVGFAVGRLLRNADLEGVKSAVQDAASGSAQPGGAPSTVRSAQRAVGAPAGAGVRS